MTVDEVALRCLAELIWGGHDDIPHGLRSHTPFTAFNLDDFIEAQRAQRSCVDQPHMLTLVCVYWRFAMTDLKQPLCVAVQSLSLFSA